MFFERIEPSPDLQEIIECYWVIEEDDPASNIQKIIPDGFTELIFHFGDPYKIKLNSQWTVQSSALCAGQITRHFSLQNTGKSNVFGVKLKPTALTHLYDLNMHTITDKVVDAVCLLPKEMSFLQSEFDTSANYNERISKAEKYFKKLLSTSSFKETYADKAIDLIFERKGMVTVAELCGFTGIGERQLENYFKKLVGLSPKFFCRIIRFNYIFDLVQKNKQQWTSLAYEAAYYDQSHFIRNFKTFTGQSPSTYSFDERNMANFFLNKK
jgi:AraC-like DNA-binding protein